MTKREAIEKAYDDLKVKDYEKYLDEYGWIHEDNLTPEQCGLFQKDVNWNQGRWQPKSLEGLWNNNGWTKIEEKGNPTKVDSYWCIDEGWEREVKMVYNGSLFLRHGWVQEPTHWRVIIELPKPLY